MSDKDENTVYINSFYKVIGKYYHFT